MRFISLVFLLLSTTILSANVVEIAKGKPFVKVKYKGKVYKIKRNSKVNAYLKNTYALTSRPSPPFFVQAFKVAKGIETFGELEVLDFISKQKGVFIDARLKNWYAKSAIPTAVNMPFKIFLSKSAKRTKLLESLGVIEVDNKLDFSSAKIILLYCNGAWCGQSPTAIHALIDLGYPKEKMKYYRGGMQSWQLLGLTTIVPKGKK